MRRSKAQQIAELMKSLENTKSPVARLAIKNKIKALEANKTIRK